MVAAGLRLGACALVLGLTPVCLADDGIIDVRTRVDRERPWLHQQVVLEVVVTHRLYSRPAPRPRARPTWRSRSPVSASVS